MMNIATHIQWRKFSWKGGGGGSFANFRYICFDFVYYFILILYLFNYLIRCVCKKSFLPFSYFHGYSKNMQNQNKFVGNSQSFAPPPHLFNWISATVYVLQYSSFWNHKAKSYGIKNTSYAHKTTLSSYAFKTYKFDSYWLTCYS